MTIGENTYHTYFIGGVSYMITRIIKLKYFKKIHVFEILHMGDTLLIHKKI